MLGTILASSKQFKPRRHRPRSTIIGEMEAVTDVRQAMSFGNQEFNTLAVELVGFIAQGTAEGFAGEQDSSGFINDKRGIACLHKGARQKGGIWHLTRQPMRHPNR